MAIPASGPLAEYATIGTELGVAQTNVSIRGMSQTAGFTQPDAFSEFYGYSSNPCTDIVDNYDPFGGGVALYQFENNANDESTTYNGTWVGSSAYTTGVFGQSAQFNGSSKIQTPINTTNFVSNLNDRTVDFSISLWINPFVIPSSGEDLVFYIGNYNVYSPQYHTIQIQLKDGSLRFSIYEGVTEHIILTSSLSVGNWYNIVCIRESAVMKLYVNNSFIGQTTQTNNSSISASATLQFGDVYSAGAYYNGLLDQVRFFTRALDPLEVEALYTEELCICDGTVDTLQVLGDTSCIATYPLDGNGNDLSGNYSGTPIDVSYGVGEFDLAGVFNGSSSRVAIPNIVNQAANHSASIWINPTNFNANRGALSMFNGSHLLVYVTTDAGLNSQGAPSAAGSTAGTLTANAWNHIVLSYNYSTTTYTMYVNGVNRGVDVNFNFSGRPNSIGCHHTGPSYGAFFLGSIDQVRIFNKALSQAEVTTLYNETACAPGGCSGTADTLNILGDGSCIAAYPLDGSPADLSGNYNGVQTNVTYPQGEFDLAGAFNGSSSVIVLPSNIIPTNYVASLSVWVKGASFSNSGSADIIFQNANGGPFFALITQNNVLELFTRNSSASNYRPFQYSLSNFNTTDWYHICVTFSGLSNTVNLYVNGVNVDSGSLQSSSLTYTLSNTIGNQEGSEIGWNGLIDQVRFFNKALSAGEVTTLYNETPCS